MNNVDIKIISQEPKVLPLTENYIVQIVNDSLKKINPDLTGKLEIEIIFASEKEIKKLNLSYRKVDAPTDVLSFPQSQIKESLENILGSIVICLKKVDEKGEDLTDVIKHGLLHLLGYDHEENEKKWEEAAKKIDCKL